MSGNDVELGEHGELRWFKDDVEDVDSVELKDRDF